MSDDISRIQNALPIPMITNGYEDVSHADSQILGWLVTKAQTVPPYWSMGRDAWLRNFSYDNGPIKTALSTFVNKLVTIPFHVQAKDHSVYRYVQQANDIESNLRRLSGSMNTGFMKGFRDAYKMFAFDYLSTDNGAFMTIIGSGRHDGPIIGAPLGVMHLDSNRCIRTKDSEFPVKYLHDDGKQYKLHYTRVIEMANLPSPKYELNGVGLCPVSCCIEAAQELWDMYTYSAEKFGSKPPKQILYAKKGATVKNLTDAVEHWRVKVESDGKTRFGGTLIAAPRAAGQELELDLIDLSSAPDGFVRRDSTIINKAEIAAAFGLDLRDLSFSFGVSGQTRADAEVQDRKGRGKGVGEFIETFAEKFSERFLNVDLFEFISDYVDDEQDEQRALIRDMRSTARERDLRSGITNVRTERELMWQRDEVSIDQFEDMELLSGRLPNGLDVLLLFQTEDRQFQEWLDLGVEDPTDIKRHNAETMLDAIHRQMIVVSTFINLQKNSRSARKGRQGNAALEKLQSLYQEKINIEEQRAMQMEAEDNDNGNNDATQVQSGRNGNDNDTEQNVQEDLDITVQNFKDLVKKKQLDLDEVDTVLDRYEDEFVALLEMANNGEADQRFVEDAFAELVAAILLALFLRGSERSETDFTEELWGALMPEVNLHIRSSRRLVQEIFSNFIAGTPLSISSLRNRINIWMNKSASVYFLGTLYRPDDPFLQWEFDPIKDHCSDCLRLDGQVHQASEWRNENLYPRGSMLECGGFHCGCRWVEVEGPSVGNF